MPAPIKNLHIKDGNYCAQVNVTAFSASGVKPAVADRAWAETPSQKLARLTAAAEAGPATLPGPAADAAQKRAAATAQVTAFATCGV